MADAVRGMMKALKKKLSAYYYGTVHPSALGYRLRRVLGGERLAEEKPFDPSAAVSDLFVWRCDDVWETEFDLFNLTSFLFADRDSNEPCDILLFDAAGKKVKEFSLTLEPMERRILILSSLLPPGISGAGTFSVFHHSPRAGELAARHSHLTERGYIGYRRRGDSLKSYCHGNLQSLSRTAGKGGHGYVAVTEAKPEVYYPQLILSDCDRAELVYTNPSSKARRICVRAYARDGRLLRSVNSLVPPCGVSILPLDNADRAIHTFDNIGDIAMWRPVIFKHTPVHFDAMHG